MCALRHHHVGPPWRVRLPGRCASCQAPTESLCRRRESRIDPARCARTASVWTPHLAPIYVTARAQLLPSTKSANPHLRAKESSGRPHLVSMYESHPWSRLAHFLRIASVRALIGSPGPPWGAPPMALPWQVGRHRPGLGKNMGCAPSDRQCAVEIGSRVTTQPNRDGPSDQNPRNVIRSRVM